MTIVAAFFKMAVDHFFYVDRFEPNMIIRLFILIINNFVWETSSQVVTKWLFKLVQFFFFIKPKYFLCILSQNREKILLKISRYTEVKIGKVFHFYGHLFTVLQFARIICYVLKFVISFTTVGSYHI